MTYSFFVAGIPKTAGSKRAFPNRKTGIPIIVDTCNNRDWKNAVAAKAAETIPTPLEGPVNLHVQFFLPTPKVVARRWHKQTKRHTTKPDLTKLVRCFEDALKGIAWRDDSQVFHTMAVKSYDSVNFCKPGARAWLTNESEVGE